MVNMTCVEDKLSNNLLPASLEREGSIYLLVHDVCFIHMHIHTHGCSINIFISVYM